MISKILIQYDECDLRSMVGTYTLLDENFQNTAATISLYIRISYLDKCVITEIMYIEKYTRGWFRARTELDEEEPYHLQQLTTKDLQRDRWDILPPFSRGRLICCCNEIASEELMHSTGN